MRKLYLTLLLPLLLVIAQQAAAVHEFSHYTDAAAKSQQQDKRLPGGNLCEKCLSFAQVAGAVHAVPPVLALVELSYDYALSFHTPVIAAEVPACRNRGPPTLL